MSTDAPPSKDSPTDEKPQWLTRFNRSLPIILLGWLVIASGGVKVITEGVETSLVLLHLKPDALDLARDTARGQFSDALVRLQWRRLFWTRRFVTAVSYKLPSQDQAEIWKAYLGTVEEWTTNSMVNILGLENYYSRTTKRRDFESGINVEFVDIHDCLLRLKYPEVFSSRPVEERLCHNNLESPPTSYPPSIEKLEEALSSLNSDIYCFAAGLGKKNASCFIRQGGGVDD